jgi:CubicO group peptidase (beta-lactamase class C family)
MDSRETLDRYFQELERKGSYSGVVLVTQGDSRLYSAAYGYASRPWKVRNTLETRFDTASITKLFTAVATAQCVDRGFFDLNTSAIEYLGLEGTSISPAATVFHLLTHSSGIGDDCEEEDGEIYEELWLNKANYLVTQTEDFLPQFIHKPPNFAPGKGSRYCNCSFVLLGLMIEKATGRTYREYVRQNVFARAGMVDSDFYRMDRVQENVAEGADPIRDEGGAIVGWKKNIYGFPPVGSPDAGAHVTAADLDRFLRALQAGALLSPESTAAFLTPQVPYRDRAEWKRAFGYVLEFFIDAQGEVDFYQKDGINAGVSGIIRHFPDRDINVVLLSNMEDGVWEPVWEVHRLVEDGAFDNQVCW